MYPNKIIPIWDPYRKINLSAKNKYLQEKHFCVCLKILFALYIPSI